MGEDFWYKVLLRIVRLRVVFGQEALSENRLQRHPIRIRRVVFASVGCFSACTFVDVFPHVYICMCSLCIQSVVVRVHFSCALRGHVGCWFSWGLSCEVVAFFFKASRIVEETAKVIRGRQASLSLKCVWGASIQGVAFLVHRIGSTGTAMQLSRVGRCLRGYRSVPKLY